MIGKFKILLLGVMALYASNVKSQDFHLSMYDAAPLFLNPAMTGVVDADWRIHGQFRTQWKSVNFKPYTTALISFDAPVKKWGFGGQIINYRAGIGNYNVLQAAGSVGYTVSLDRNRFHNLSFGLQAGITQKAIEMPLHTFDNQYTTVGGGSFDNTLNSNETFASRSLLVPVTNAGILYYFSKQQSKLNPFIGASGFNLIEPKESFFEADNTLAFRYYVHAGIRVNITEKLYLIPKLLYMQQETITEQTIALDGGLYFETAEMYLLGGAVFRNKDAAILSLGAKKENYVLKVAYDINVSSLSGASTGRGGFEVSFTYMKKKADPKNVKICPRL